MAPHRTHERFRTWLDGTGWSPMEAAIRLGCDRSYLPRLLDGTRTPGLKIAVAIQRRTANLRGGPIRCEDWLDPAELDALDRAAGEVPRRKRAA